MDVDREYLQGILTPNLSVQEAIDIILAQDEDGDVVADSIFIEPPDPGVLTEEDSGDEDTGGTLDNLSSRQLRAPAEIRYNDQRENDPIPFQHLSVSAKRTWIQGDMVSFCRPFPIQDYKKYCDFSVLELFELFFDDELIEHLVQESNNYAIFKNCENPNIRSDEIKCFFAILILSSYNSVSNKRLYWDTHKDTRNDLICNAIRRNWFEQILRFLHCADNNEVSTTDKMWKLRPLIENIQKKCLKHFVAQKNLSYDESMVKYYGKHSCKQFIRGKPIRFGYKVWSLNTTDGYLVNFNVYQGKSHNPNTEYEANFGKAAAPLIQMIDDFPEPIKKLPFNFFFDNLFTGFKLLVYLREHGYGGTGTVRENRIPRSCPLASKNELLKKERGYYEHSISKEDGILVLKWVDNSVVSVATNCLSVEPVKTVDRFSQKDKQYVKVNRPFLVSEYNKNMGGVDRMDQNIGEFRINIRNKKWYWPLLSWLIDVCVNNAWMLARYSGKKLTQLEFRREIVQVYLVRYANPRKAVGRPVSISPSIRTSRVSSEIQFDGLLHLVKKTEKKRRCAGEKCRKKTSAVRTICGKCDVGLCIECFEDFQTVSK